MEALSTTITDADSATKAAEWCQKHHIIYDIEYWGWPGSNKYKFIFTNNRDLMLFSLKWI